MPIPLQPRVVAIVAAYNEADLISQVIEDLVGQGISVYLIDDGSTDATVTEATRWLDRGLIAIERRPPSEAFDWTAILRRKEALAMELGADWYIHHDADEFRECPWPGMTLLDGIHEVDRLGYNAIDFRVLNFMPTGEEWAPEQDIRETFSYYKEGDEWDALQIKAWKRTAGPVDLASSGGHEAAFEGRRVCPVPFLLRHYPLRGDLHGSRKIFLERIPRFLQGERERGWHVQYDAYLKASPVVLQPAMLRRFDRESTHQALSVLHRYSRQLDAAQSREQQMSARLEAAEAALPVSREREEATVGRLREAEATVEAVRGREEEALRRLREAEVRIEATRAELKAAERKVIEQTDIAAQLQQRLTASQSETRAGEQRHQREARELQSRIVALHESLSWRLTQPLRAAYDVLMRQTPPTAPAPAAGIDWGELGRDAPLSQVWGFDRGVPIDRHYIYAFLDRHRRDIRGHVLEVKDSGYTVLFGDDRVRRSSVQDVDPRNERCTVIGDLSRFGSLEVNAVDCFILTQTLHLIFDLEQAVREAVRVLAPGGTLLCTLPAVSRLSYADGDARDIDFWRVTAAAVKRLFAGPEVASVEISTYGNVQTCAAFLYGLAASEVPASVLDYHDPLFPLMHAVRLVRRP